MSLSDPTAASSVTLAPTPRAAELLHALFEETCKCGPQAPAGVLVLSAPPEGCSYRYRDSCTHRTTTHAGEGFEWWLQTPYIPSGHERSGVWYGFETRTDANGEKWVRTMRNVVHDDFGFLVEVSS